MMGDYQIYSSVTMNAAAPDGAHPRRTNNKNFKQPTRPAVPRRGPEAGCIVYCTIFMVRVKIPVHACFYRAKKIYIMIFKNQS